MRHYVASDEVALLPLVLAAILASCTGDSTSATSADASAPPSTTEGGLNKPDDAAGESSLGLDAAADEGPGPNPEAGADVVADAAPPIGSLSLTLDPSIDIDGDTVKATTITSVDLLDTKGSTRASATVSGAIAVVSFAGIAAGDYFLKVNGDADDLVPTRVNTWSAGQKESPVVGFSDDKAIDGAQPYLVYTFASSQLELRVLGTGRSLSSFPLGRCPGHADVPADGWLLNTTGEDHHGDVFNADGGAANCGGCHMNYWMKKPSYSEISPSRGWCFKCHDGTDGTSTGFVDSTH